jgi:hypothetical protein
MDWEVIMTTSHRLFKLYVFALVMVVAALSNPDPIQATTHFLDGKTFVGPTGPKGEEADGEEELIFKDGKVLSVPCANWGFGWADYTARVEGDTVHFESVMLSAKHGKIVWRGTMKGEKLDSTFVWTKERWYWKDAFEESWFKGTLKK